MFDLSLYDVSEQTGFLPEEAPLIRLPAYFDPWENIANEIPALLATRRIRQFVDKMPLLDCSLLSDEPQWRRAYSILGFIGNAYVWGGGKPAQHLPEQLADPWITTGEHFDIPPIATYAGLCLWNFRTLAPGEDFDLESLATINTFTGAYDESWFYLVSVAIERQGGPCIKHGLRALEASERDDVTTVVEELQHLAESIDGLIGVLKRMSDNCDPHFFYSRLRPYLAGWKNMEAAGLPDGVRYGNESKPRNYVGGSNAQSSLVHALDVLLGVEHQPLGERKPLRMPSTDANQQSSAISFQQRDDIYHYEIRKYMPRKHRQFLEDLERECDIRGYVLMNKQKHPSLVTAYDACVATLRGLRSKHIQIVMRFISMQARNSPASGAVGIAKGNGETGTGGTALMPFLKQARDETGDVAAGEWGRRLLTSVPHMHQDTNNKSTKVIDNDDLQAAHW